MGKKKDFTKDIEESLKSNSFSFDGLVGLGSSTPTASSPVSPTQLVSVSRELVDSTLKSNYEIETRQTSLFEYLEEPIQQRIEREGEKRLALEYLHLSQAESKLISTLANLLYDQNKTDKSGNVVLHDNNSSKFPKGGKQRQSAVLKIKAQDLYKEYTGKDNPSGRDRQQIHDTLVSLTQNRIFIWETRDSKGKEFIERDHIPYLFLKEIIPKEDLTKEEIERIKSNKLQAGDIAKVSEYNIFLNPVFTSHWYILRPRDLEERTLKLVGSKRVSTAVTRLRDYLMGFISGKKYDTQIGEVKLIYKLGLEKRYKKEGAGSKYIQGRIEEALNVSKGLGIIKDYSREPSLTGDYKYIFKLNNNFYNDYNDIIEGEIIE